MSHDRRLVFVSKWFKRGLTPSDPFDQCFSL